MSGKSFCAHRVMVDQHICLWFCNPHPPSFSHHLWFEPSLHSLGVPWWLTQRVTTNSSWENMADFSDGIKESLCRVVCWSAKESYQNYWWVPSWWWKSSDWLVKSCWTHFSNNRTGFCRTHNTGCSHVLSSQHKWLWSCHMHCCLGSVVKTHAHPKGNIWREKQLLMRQWYSHGQNINEKRTQSQQMFLLIFSIGDVCAKKLRKSLEQQSDIVCGPSNTKQKFLGGRDGQGIENCFCKWKQRVFIGFINLQIKSTADSFALFWLMDGYEIVKRFACGKCNVVNAGIAVQMIQQLVCWRLHGSINWGFLSNWSKFP